MTFRADDRAFEDEGLNALAPDSANLVPVSMPLGDVNHDGAFDFADIESVGQSGKYLSGQDASFSQGDWNGDGLFDQLDLVAALQRVDFGAPTNFLQPTLSLTRPLSDRGFNPLGHMLLPLGCDCSIAT